MRLIDADALKEDLKLPGESGRMGELLGMVIDAVIEDAPTIEERKTGAWILLDSDTDRYDEIKCPCCKHTFTVDAYHWTDIGFTKDDLKFCPNCGEKTS